MGWVGLNEQRKSQKGSPCRKVVSVYYGVVDNWVGGFERANGKPEGESISTGHKCLLWCCGNGDRMLIGMVKGKARSGFQVGESYVFIHLEDRGGGRLGLE